VPSDVHGAYLSLVQVLGARTAELHLALARPSGDPAFEPEPLTAADVAAYRDRAAADLRACLDMLEARAAELPPMASDDARAVLAGRERLLARLDECAAEPPQALKTRHHGDYHLGQVLLSNNDFVIVDFEGEPARSFEQRRAKHSPLRDVAGMLRSFDYAQWSALRRVAREPVDLERLAPLARHWKEQACATFLRAYDEAARSAALYGSLAPGRGLLGLFEIEKALYELRYELESRPDWVQIPLRGLRAAIER
jgi:maltose alpha-D-glucosyltransferase / alpha-amylase